MQRNKKKSVINYLPQLNKENIRGTKNVSEHNYLYTSGISKINSVTITTRTLKLNIWSKGISSLYLERFSSKRGSCLFSNPPIHHITQRHHGLQDFLQVTTIFNEFSRHSLKLPNREDCLNKDLINLPTLHTRAGDVVQPEKKQVSTLLPHYEYPSTPSPKENTLNIPSILSEPHIATSLLSTNGKF